MAEMQSGAGASTQIGVYRDSLVLLGVSYQGYQGYQDSMTDKHYFTAFTVDEETGSMYFKLKPLPSEIVKSVPYDTQIVQDIDKKGETVGIELLVTDKGLLASILQTLKYSYQH